MKKFLRDMRTAVALCISWGWTCSRSLSARMGGRPQCPHSADAMGKLGETSQGVRVIQRGNQISATGPQKTQKQAIFSQYGQSFEHRQPNIWPRHLYGFNIKAGDVRQLGLGFLPSIKTREGGRGAEGPEHAEHASKPATAACTTRGSPISFIRGFIGTWVPTMRRMEQSRAEKGEEGSILRASWCLKQCWALWSLALELNLSSWRTGRLEVGVAAQTASVASRIPGRWQGLPSISNFHSAAIYPCHLGFMCYYLVYFQDLITFFIHREVRFIY